MWNFINITGRSFCSQTVRIFYTFSMLWFTKVQKINPEFRKLNYYYVLLALINAVFHFDLLKSQLVEDRTPPPQPGSIRPRVFIHIFSLTYPFMTYF